MTLTDNYLRLRLEQVIIKREERQRKEIEVDDLLASIAKNGVIHPIIVKPVEGEAERYELVAGERRYSASDKLGLKDIPARLASTLSPVESKLIELEENLKRKDLPWQDQCDAIAELHKLHIELDAEWSMGETAAILGLTLGSVSVYLRVHSELKDAKVQTSGTVREAWNVLKRRDQRNASDVLEDLVGITKKLEASPSTPSAPSVPGAEPAPVPAPAPPPPEIICADFKLWASEYDGPKFNVLHVDFPYGANMFGGAQGQGMEREEGYDDGPEVFWALVETLCQSLDKIMSFSGHLMFWFSEQQQGDRTAGARLRAFFAENAPSLRFAPFPLIWFKSDNAGIVQDPRRLPRHVYETCLFASRGDRMLVQPKADCYPCPTDRSLHPSAKPEPMLKHFMSMFVDEQSTVLDPTCGSGSALRAADSLGAKRLLGLERDEAFASAAAKSLRTAQTLRSLNKREKGK